MDEYDVHERDKFGKTILHYYIETMKDLSIDFREVFEELFKRGLDVDEKQLKGPFKRSYLHMAVNQNKIELFNYLLSNDHMIKILGYFYKSVYHRSWIEIFY